MNPEQLTSTKQIMILCFNKVNHFIEIHLVDLYVFRLCNIVLFVLCEKCHLRAIMSTYSEHWNSTVAL